MFRFYASSAMLGVAMLSLSSPALGDDWVVTKLRGAAAVLTGETWGPLKRGDVVSDDRAIQTLDGGRITLQRGKEVIELGPHTAVRIDDRTGQQFTTVKQYFGTVAVEAEVKDVQHFAVRTPYLAAVVKGTRFTVHSDDEGADVSVERGRVAVTDGETGERATVVAGETVSTGGEDGGLEVSATDAPGNSLGRGRSDDAAERSAGAPGQSGERGNSGDAPGQSGERGNSENAPGHSGESNGNGGGQGNAGSSNAGGNSDGGGNGNGGGNGRGNS